MIENFAVRGSEMLDRPPTPDLARMAREVVAYLARAGAPCAASPGDTLGNDLAVVARSCLGWTVRRLNGEMVPE